MIDLETIVQEAVIESWGIDPERYDADKTFHELGADSLDVIELYMAVESQLDIPDIQEEAPISTPNELVAYLLAQGLAPIFPDPVEGQEGLAA